MGPAPGKQTFQWPQMHHWFVLLKSECGMSHLQCYTVLPWSTFTVVMFKSDFFIGAGFL